jgi:hypothetical protein
MAYVYAKADELEAKAKVGTKQCVALVQCFTAVPHTSLWRAGETVAGNKAIAKGTVIATFANGRYLSLRQGNHAAFFLRACGDGIWVMDQWADDIRKKAISERLIRARGANKDGSYPNPVNNADAYSVVER